MSRSRGPDDGCSIRIRRKFGSFGNQFGELRKFGRRALRTYVRSGEMGSLRGSAAARTLLQADKNEPPTVVGVNINIPIPVISDLLGSETPHKDRYVRVFSHRTDRSAPHPIPSPYTLTLYPHPTPSPARLPSRLAAAGGSGSSSRSSRASSSLPSGSPFVAGGGIGTYTGLGSPSERHLARCRGGRPEERCHSRARTRPWGCRMRGR